jgi:hypothetical protein
MNPRLNAVPLSPDVLTSLEDWGAQNLDAEVLSGRFTSGAADDIKLLQDE